MNCPICAKKTDESYRPFCSKRCADLDLSKWLSGSYAVPAVELDDVDEAELDAARRAGEQETHH